MMNENIEKINDGVLLLDDTQYRYTPDVGTVEGPVFCGVCRTQMTERRDVEGYRGFVSAMAKVKSRYDSFDCPHSNEDWHKQVIALREAARKTPSPTLAHILLKDTQEILGNRVCTKKGYWY
jgi:hypothetical protein